MGCQFSWWNRDITCKLYTCIWKYACMYKVGNGCSRASVASLSQHIFIFTGIWIVASVIIKVKRWNVQWHPKHMHLSDNYVTTLNKKFFIVILEFNLEVLPCGILKMIYQCQFYVYTEEESSCLLTLRSFCYEYTQTVPLPAFNYSVLLSTCQTRKWMDQTGVHFILV